MELTWSNFNFGTAVDAKRVGAVAASNAAASCQLTSGIYSVFVLSATAFTGITPTAAGPLAILPTAWTKLETAVKLDSWFWFWFW